MSSSLDILIKITSIFISLIIITGKIHSNLAEISNISCTDCNISNATVIESAPSGAGHYTRFFLKVTAIYFMMQAMDRLSSILKVSVGFDACILAIGLLKLHLRAELTTGVIHCYTEVIHHVFDVFITVFHFLYFFICFCIF